MLTNDERAALAIFAGWLYETNGNWMTKDGVSIPCYDWHPATDGRQILMVLDGLVKKTMERFTAYTKDKTCRIILHQLATMPEMPEDNWLGNVVCAAALEIINQKGGERC